MFKRIIIFSITIVILLLYSIMISISPSICGSSPTSGNTIVVPDDAKSINMAISMAPNGGIVKLRRGIYMEEVYINKPIALVGEADARILSPVKILNARNIMLSGISLEIYPAGTEIGLALLNVSGLRLENLRIIGTWILIVNSTGIEVRNCTFTENPGPAIQVRGPLSRNILIENCIFNNTYMALSAQSGKNITFRYNTVYAKHLSIKLYSAASNTTIYLNNIISGEAEDYGENNRWYNETLKLGNLWGNPNPEGDRDGDGRIDEPKTIGGTANSRDEYPLAKPFTEYLEKENTTEEKADNKITLTIITATIIVVSAAILIVARKNLLKREALKHWLRKTPRIQTLPE